MDAGSVADWVGAIGGLAGAGTAAAFYFLDRRRADAARVLEEQRQAAFEKDMLTHVYILVRSAVSAARKYRGSLRAFSDTTDLRAELAALAATAERMREIPGLPIEMFMTLCRLLEAITDIRIEGRDPFAVFEAAAHILYVAEPFEDDLGQSIAMRATA